MTHKQGLYGWIAWGMFCLVHRQLSKHNDRHERENRRVRPLVRKRPPGPGDKHPIDAETAQNTKSWK